MRGRCRKCGYSKRLLADGTVGRHWAYFGPHGMAPSMQFRDTCGLQRRVCPGAYCEPRSASEDMTDDEFGAALDAGEPVELARLRPRTVILTSTVDARLAAPEPPPRYGADGLPTGESK